MRATLSFVGYALMLLLFFAAMALCARDCAGFMLLTRFTRVPMFFFLLGMPLSFIVDEPGHLLSPLLRHCLLPPHAVSVVIISCFIVTTIVCGRLRREAFAAAVAAMSHLLPHACSLLLPPRSLRTAYATTIRRQRLLAIVCWSYAETTKYHYIIAGAGESLYDRDRRELVLWHGFDAVRKIAILPPRHVVTN